MGPPGRIEPHDVATFGDLQTAADMDGGGRNHLAAFEHADLGRAAADVDVEHALAQIERSLRGAGAIGGEHGFHVVAGGGADEFAALL